MKRARLFEPIPGEGRNVKCKACAQECVISKGKGGLCGVRKNINGKLFSLTYGKLVAQHIDPIEKKPLFRFMPGSIVYSIGTVGCNFACEWCQNFDISQVEREDQIIGKDTTPREIVNQALNQRCESIAYTYNEPAINTEFVREIARIAKRKGLKNIFVTNGYFTKESFEYLNKEGLVDAMNIDLKSFRDETYRKYCRATRGVKPVLETIKRAKRAGVHLELTTLVIPDLNDSEEELDEIAKFVFSLDGKGETPWHISRFFPMFKFSDRKPTSLEKLKKAEEIGKSAGLKYVYLGNV